MIHYTFYCEECGHIHSFEQSIKDDLPISCPKCGSTDKYFQDYNKEQFFIIEGEPTTFGQQSERNKKKMGKELCQKKDEEILGPKKERPWWRDTDKPLDVKKIKDVKKYVKTGIKT